MYTTLLSLALAASSCFSASLAAPAPAKAHAPALASSAASAPAPSHSIDVTVSPTPGPDAISPKSMCASQNADGHINWAVYIANTTMPSDQGDRDSLGGGLIDNLRGRGLKCNPMNWQAQDDGRSPLGVAATFSTKTNCEGWDVAAAIMASSAENDDHVITAGTGQNVHCDGDPIEAKIKQQEKDVQTFISALGAAGSLLGGFAKLPKA